MWVDVGARADFEDGVPRVIEVNGRELGLIAWRDEVYAVRNICPHQYAPVCSGHTMPLLVEQGGCVEVDDDRLVLICPWHSWEFEARSGKATWSDHFKLKTYATRVQDGRVLVDGGRPKSRQGAASTGGASPPSPVVASGDAAPASTGAGPV